MIIRIEADTELWYRDTDGTRRYMYLEDDWEGRAYQPPHRYRKDYYAIEYKGDIWWVAKSDCDIVKE